MLGADNDCFQIDLDTRYIEFAEPSSQELVSLEHSIDTIRYLCSLAEFSNLPIKVLQFFAEHPLWQVREAVSDNPGLPVETLCELSRDEHDDVRFAIAENHRTPAHILGELCIDDNPFVANRASQTLQRVRANCRFSNKKNTEIEITRQFKMDWSAAV